MEKIKTKGYGASGALIGGKTLELMEFDRSEPKPDEILIDVLYCGVCHSDLHQVNNDWKNTIYPCVPGHEIIGKVISTGSSVSKFKAGDLVGVGCMIDSCKHCDACLDGEEQFCEGPVGQTMTYNGYWKPDGTDFNTFGGYSTNIVAQEKFVMSIPESLNPAAAAPILCAGVTTYSPLKHFGVKAGHKVGVVGIGGLGHMGVKIAKAMGASVTAITTKVAKRESALGLGADDVLISEDKEAMKAQTATFDFLLITIPYPFDINDYIPLIRRRGAIVTVGLLAPYKAATNNMEVAKFSSTVGGSMIGGTIETQEVLDFCAEHGIAPDVQMIDIKDINEALNKVKEEEVRFRYVIDMATLKN
ncbi:NAD(P)-dependent alcohol dehydrogenase [Pedobacter fastidiosus]|uniref:NAD(P)-dependent alcohol dehydrogenase n=1 Tax=Pedobacter fastidiosus TaxID=2765361 RepID=A0ABR7KRZ6_9SPHI|nr:NAD(P)-dependent alcohol dehydrogenase [Pedobacter fastidiosus]MBC6110527.1 NAD(P)-dependent alcohol dehydrogenase [Pedobacter fastidiosus]